ncbi:DUF6286 domain-containing protein [Spongiactinospora sp. TRM90649]|uniref:DUF6286 domain-containing protein n=1 Tax=Spongiactinospora sp. TRM90649 TaxID=3031114 RepID=UPI0023F6AD42|nr:DUF6286 domain-containing protein [Spongiactinospora sp. TRM90649]MDF5753367.1 DUF6286 domain-containing protein [Spongiactinospora sp. TRM90649]
MTAVEERGPKTSGTSETSDAAHRPPKSRRADRAAAHVFRPRRVWPAIIVSALLLAIGLIAAIEIISALAGHPARIVPYQAFGRWAAGTPWSDPRMLTGAAIAAVLGLILLLIALVPGRPRFVPLRTGDRDLIIGMQRRSFVHAIERAAESVDGIGGARAHLRRGRVHVTATTSLQTAAPRLERVVRQAVTAKIAALAPVPAPDVRVSVHGRRREGRGHGT